MSVVSLLLKSIGQAFAEHGGGLLAGNPLAVVGMARSVWENLSPKEVVGEAARDAWEASVREKRRAALRAEMEELAKASAEEVRKQAAIVAQEVAAGRPEKERDELAAYLTQVPAAIRRTLRRPTDPAGVTVPAGRSFSRAEDLVPLLPARLPRFRPGDRPPGLGDWELVELLGVGGFGEVWKAHNPHLHETAALKFCLDAEAAKLLRNEVGLLRRVQDEGKHPGIVQLLDTHLSAEPPFLKYEYVPGGDLAGLIAEWHREPAGPDPQRIMNVMRQLAEIVGFAHRLKPPIVHRDLKPANILISKQPDGSEVLKVADFGIGGLAAEGTADLTRRTPSTALAPATAALGAYTPLYASPQQVRGEPPDPRDDVHALGVIWYQMLTGDLSAGAPTGRKWAQALRERCVSEGAVDLLASCVEPRAEDRPADAAVLAERLAALGAEAGPAVPGQAKPKSRRRRRLLRAGAALLAVAAIAVAVVLVFHHERKPGGLLGPGPIRTLQGHRDSVRCVAVSGDGRRIVTGSDDYSARVWDAGTGKELVSFESHGGWVRCVAFSPDGLTVASGGNDYAVRIWDSTNGRQLATHKFDNAVDSLAFSPDGSRLAVISGSSLHLFDPNPDRFRPLGSANINSSPALVAFSPDGTLLAVTESDAVGLYKANALPDALKKATDGKSELRLRTGGSSISALAFDPDGSTLATGERNGMVRWWDTKRGQEMLAKRDPDNSKILGLAFTADGKFLLVANDRGGVRVRNAADGREINKVEFDSYAQAVAFPPDGKWMAVANGREVKIWTILR